MTMRKRGKGKEEEEEEELVEEEKLGSTAQEGQTGKEEDKAREQARKEESRHQEEGEQGEEARCKCGCLNVLMALLGVIVIPMVLNNAALQHEASALLPADEHFHVVGYGNQLYLECIGQGRKTVVIEADVGTAAEEYRPLAQALATRARVCLYDRAGVGYSGTRMEMQPPSDPYSYMGATIQPRSEKIGTGERAAQDLNWLLRKANVSLPVTVVSFGVASMYSRFYAQLHEGDVGNLILVNPVHESFFISSGDGLTPDVEFRLSWSEAAASVGVECQNSLLG